MISLSSIVIFHLMILIGNSGCGCSATWIDKRMRCLVAAMLTAPIRSLMSFRIPGVFSIRLCFVCLVSLVGMRRRDL